uniref:Uncharacterized protein n=1 Tax=Anguilla anguilla TaxID=7936 RepID=A0A0E9SBA3_ANGAN
MKNHFSRSAFF